jgi:quercetin dioxygenase-like cupin family protein
MKNALIRLRSEASPKPSRRPGLAETILLGVEDCRTHNVVLVTVEAGSEVEVHEVSTHETLYVLSGAYELVLAEGNRNLGPGDLAYFEPGSAHGLACTSGPGQIVIIFAPPRLAPVPS